MDRFVKWVSRWNGHPIAIIIPLFLLGPVCFVGIEFYFNNYNLNKSN
jgi:hypothetical protein